MIERRLVEHENSWAVYEAIFKDATADHTRAFRF